MPAPAPELDREEYSDVETNPVQAVTEEPVSTFSIDVDTASYAVARSYLNGGTLPPTDAIRAEEVINYFDYAYPLPEAADAPFAASVTVTDTPWNADTQLMHIGIQGYDIELDERPRANLVFLMDVSGSMNSPDKLPLAIQGLRMMLGEMDPDDTVSIVVYASASGVVLEPTPVSERGRIEAALDSLSAGGSTAGGEGLRLAYAMAERNFDEDAVNRVIMVTDGDFNVGITQDERLEDFVARKRDTGIYLSVMGFGRGNYNDALMQTIAQAGNGTAGYVDTLQEARRLLVEEASSTLFPIANDVKIQVEFNPARVAEYRLIGYETRMLERADFNNDEVDAGEIGSGHSVTAIYEIAAPDSAGVQLDPLRYQSAPDASGTSDEFAFLRLRYKQPGEDESQLIETPVTSSSVLPIAEASEDVRFAIAAAGYAQLLRNDPYLGEWGYDDVLALAQSARGEDEFGYRAEFIQLARLAETAAAQAALGKPGAGE
ncbi:VWA domain-containing protein [Maricaulaceae bacterium NA33B04]|nr:VWA domain-containing protein [Maricaulaceae bacterium NA33B04]